MKFKIKLVIFIVLVLLLISTFKSTYAKYASSATGTATATVANWQIKLDNKDIGNSTEYTQWQTNYSNVTLDSFDNANVADGKIAPGSTGSSTIIIDASKIDVSFYMTVNAELTNAANSGLILTNASLYRSTDNSTWSLADDSIETGGTTPYQFTIANTSGAGKFYYGVNRFSYLKLVINYQWIANASDSQDTTYGHNSAITSGGKTVQIKTTLGFTQVV